MAAFTSFPNSNMADVYSVAMATQYGGVYVIRYQPPDTVTTHTPL
jgi:hypothetical protein